MHAISFLLKRAHLASTNEGQRLLYAVPGMTPARFDILCFSRQGGIRHNIPELAFTTQKRIREALGLSASTISRMLKRLEELGWIERAPDVVDRRIKTVMLTKLGRRKTWKAMRYVFRERSLAKHYEMLARNLRPNDHALDALDHLFNTLDLLAAGFGDEAFFHYDTGSHQRPPFWRYLPIRVYDADEPCDHDGPSEPSEPSEPGDPPLRRLTRYQKWVIPLIRDQEALLEARRSLDYRRDWTPCRWPPKTPPATAAQVSR